MKTHLLFRTLVFTFCFSLCTFHAHSQWVSIPDTNFGTWLNTNYPGCMQGSNQMGWQMDTSCPAVVGAISVTCNNQQIADLTGIQYFDSLRLLRCEQNNLSFLPPLPETLWRLDCFSNWLTVLPDLPSNLRELHVQNNMLSNMPALPNALTILNCEANLLLIIPDLPVTLQYLNCNRNLLTSLPRLSPQLTELWCGNNQLRYLPTLPSHLYVLFCVNNPNLNCLPPLRNIEYFYFYNTGITCLRNYPQNNSYSNPSLNSIPLCTSNNPGGCGIFWNLSGTVYTESGGGCQLSLGDQAMQNVKIKLLNGSQQLIQETYSMNDGFYGFDIDTFGLYTILVDTLNLPFTSSCNQISVRDTIVSLNDSIVSGINFPFDCTTDVDLVAWSINAGVTRPGANSIFTFILGNLVNFYGVNCTLGPGIRGYVTVSVSGPVDSVTPINYPSSLTSTNGNTIIYDVPDFGAIDFITSFQAVIDISTLAQLGDMICVTFTVTTVNTDAAPANNTLTRCFSIVNSFDPNDKTAYPAGDIDTAQEWLTYTVRFQNTGTAEAQHIYITDTLDSNIDVSSFQLLAYSHQPMVQIKEHAVRFNYPNINLPDSNTNEPESHGYVQYKVKLKEGLPIGTQINNTAFIYFDFNEPVVTNTTTNTISVISGIAKSETASLHFEMFPNPANEVVNILVDEQIRGAVLTVTDVTGRVMQTLNVAHRISNIEVKDFAAGIYFVSLQTKQGQGVTKKLVVGR